MHQPTSEPINQPTNQSMNVISRFTGYGGMELGLRLWAAKHQISYTGVLYVEWEKYAQEIIKARIRDGYMDNAPIWAGDIRKLDCTKFRGLAHVITAGFPCQSHSFAGKRSIAKGNTEDERNLWPDTLRIIREVHPRWVLLENVAGITSGSKQHGTDAFSTKVISQLVTEMHQVGATDIKVKWRILGADDVRPIPAPHRRKRWLLIAELAYPANERLQGHYEQSTQSTGAFNGYNHGELANTQGERYRGGISTQRGTEGRIVQQDEQARGEMGSETEGCDRELAYSESERGKRRGTGERGEQAQCTEEISGWGGSGELGNTIDSGVSMDDSQHDGHTRSQEPSSSGQGEYDSKEGDITARQPTGSASSKGRGSPLAYPYGPGSIENNQSSESRAEGIVEPSCNSGRNDQTQDEEVEPGGRDGNQSELPVGPPGPNQRDEWEWIIREYPWLAPAITKEAEQQFRLLVDGRSYRVGELKSLGNGLIPAVLGQLLEQSIDFS